MSNNLALPQLTANTSDKDDFINDLLSLVDSSVTAGVVIDGSVNANLGAQAVQNFAKITATNVPKAGTTQVLPQIAHVFILKNDAGSAGPVTFQRGSASVALAAGTACIAHTDGTPNGLDVVSAAGKPPAQTLAGLTDVDETTAPTDGQALLYNATEAKWKPGTLATGGTGGSSGGGSSSSGRPEITSISRNTDFAAPGGAWTPVPWDTVDVDEAGAYAPATDATKIVVPAGMKRVRITLYVIWENGSASTPYFRLDKNGTPLQGNMATQANESGRTLVTRWLPVVAGDYFQALVIPGGAQGNVQGAAFCGPSFMQAEWAAA